MSGPRALLLDAMGTLVRLRPPAPALRRGLLERFGIEISEAQARRAFAREISFYRAHLQEGSDSAGVDALRARCAEVLRAALEGIGPVAALTAQDMRRLLLDSLHFDPYPDALPAMMAARARGARVVVVSNWDVSLHGVLQRTGLAAAADHVLTSAECGARKPAPEIFLRALELAGVAAGEALHVGDSVEEDLGGARAAGIPHALLVRDGATTLAGVVAIGGLDAVPDAWRRLTCADV